MGVLQLKQRPVFPVASYSHNAVMGFSFFPLLTRFFTHSVLHFSAPIWDEQVQGEVSGVVQGFVMYVRK